MSSNIDIASVINDSLIINRRVVNAFADILLSTNKKTRVQGISKNASEFFHLNGRSHIYDRDVKASDMFGNRETVISDFKTSKIPDILHDNLYSRIVPLSAINENVVLEFDTIAATYKANQITKQHANSFKNWGVFSLDDNWPMSYGLSLNHLHNITLKNKNTYSFIKLNTKIDAKINYFTVNTSSTVLPDEPNIPAVFILLDTIDAEDGDSFDFKIQYEDDGVDSNPTFFFFDSKSNSNAIPLPSISSDRDSNPILNNSIKIDGIDYRYTKASALPDAVRLENGLMGSDRVFVSIVDHKQKIYNTPGKVLLSQFGYDITRKSFLGYGITKNESIVLYSTDVFDFVSECPIDTSSSLSYTKRKNIFSKRSNISKTLGGYTFSSAGGSSACFGRPSSFFNADFSSVTVDSMTNPKKYSNVLEGLRGNILNQYKGELIPGPNSGVNNGLLVSFDVSVDQLENNKVVIRFGHFDSVVGVNTSIDADNLWITMDGLLTGSQYNMLATQTAFKCLFSAIMINGSLYTRYAIVKDGVVLANSEPRQLKPMSALSYAEDALGSELYSLTVKAMVYSQNIFEYWNPCLTVGIKETDSTSNTKVSITNMNITHSLAKEELTMMWDLSLQPRNPIEDMEYIVLRPENVKGFIAKIDNIPLNTYSVGSSAYTLSNAYRIGFTYSAYKGQAFAQPMIVSDPLVKTKSTVGVTKPQYELEIANKSAASEFTEVYYTNKSHVDFENEVEDSSDYHLASSGDVVRISKSDSPGINVDSKFNKVSSSTTVDVDNIHGYFGWKINTLYQMLQNK